MVSPSTVHALLTLTLFLLVLHVHAFPVTVDFLDCFDKTTGNASLRLSISSVYAQVVDTPHSGTHLNLTVLGSSPHDIVGFTNTSGSLTTLFTSTSVLTLNAWSNSSYFCSTLRPPSPLPQITASDATYCPIPAGPFAFTSSIPWGSRRALTTLTTRLRAVDPLVNELFCIDVVTTPLDPEPGFPYGRAKIVFWCTVALALAYWIVVGLARVISAWGRGITRHDSVWSRARSAGFIIASAVSGERLATSPALLRFCTPSMRDIFFHTQWCAVLAMVSVQWPPFVYPLLTQTAWSTLSFNVTLLQSAAPHRWNPLSTAPYLPPQNFADQLGDISSPIFVNSSLPNILFTLPEDSRAGISSFAYTIGIRPEDLFPTCMILFLALLTGTIALAIIIGLIDHFARFLVKHTSGHTTGPISVARMTGRGSGFTNIKDSADMLSPGPSDENKSLNGQNAAGVIFRPPSRLSIPLTGGSATERGIYSHRAWWRCHIPIGSFHGSVLQGNLVRILVLFHLPVTIFSTYQMTLPRAHVSLASKTLAGLSFALFSILIPAHLVLRVTLTTTNKLYAETNTLLSLGPLYNHYRHGSQLFASLLFASNFVFGIAVGAAQHSGTAQAVVILVVEVASALVTSIWLPWGTGASMGLISFLLCVARIVIAVLLVILTPTISIGFGAASWVAYGILMILALVYLAFSLMLVVKLVEALVRIVGRIGFDQSAHVVDSGLLGACGLLSCCGSRKRHRKRATRPSTHPYKATQMHLHHKYRESDGSSYVPPIFPSSGGAASGSLPRFHGPDSRKGSTNSGPPPSVLRPEHAMRPYKEDDEDEGFIMGAWQRPPKPGYTPLLNETSQTQSSQPFPKTPLSVSTAGQPGGFSRVGGGRAHIDSPYAIMSGSTYTFPPIGRQNMTPPTFSDTDDSPPPSLSTVNIHRQDYSTLPPGAMHPSHIRTKSQSAVIEDAGILATMQALRSSSTPPMQTTAPPIEQTTSSGGLLRPPVLSSELPADHDEDSEHIVRKKKPWYRMRRHKQDTSDGSPPAVDSPPRVETLPVDEEFGGLGTSPRSGRSFVVIRKPQSTGGPFGQPGPSGSSAPNATT